MSNMWEPNTEPDYEDEEDDDEIIPNDEPSADIDNEFRKKVLDLKHILYENTVLSPKLGTVDAQNTSLANKYLGYINNIYILCEKAKHGQIDKNDLRQFPTETRELINNILVSITNYFKNKEEVDKIPYIDYINKSFREYQFSQNNSFN